MTHEKKKGAILNSFESLEKKASRKNAQRVVISKNGSQSQGSIRVLRTFHSGNWKARRSNTLTAVVFPMDFVGLKLEAVSIFIG